MREIKASAITEVVARLKSIGAMDAHTLTYINHFSHNGKNACYDDYAPLAEKDGILTSYDGMEIEF